MLSPSKLGIEDFDGGRYEDGFLSCSFKRPTVVEVAKYGQTFNLEKDKYIIFLAEGSFRGGQMFKHRRKTKSAELQVGDLQNPNRCHCHMNRFLKLSYPDFQSHVI